MSLDSAPQYFVNADARGGLIDGKQSYTVAQAANQIIRGEAGWSGVEWQDHAGGIVALHRGWNA